MNDLHVTLSANNNNNNNNQLLMPYRMALWSQGKTTGFLGCFKLMTYMYSVQLQNTYFIKIKQKLECEHQAE